jgi:hypothetical protein
VFATSLVEPNTNVSLPVFSQVYVGKDVVMLNHFSITKVLYLIN